MNTLCYVQATTKPTREKNEWVLNIYYHLQKYDNE